MATYPGKQSIIIFAVCAISVGGVAFYAYHPFSGRTEGPDGPQISSAALMTAPIAIEGDWRGQFLSATSSSGRYGSSTAATKAAEAADLTATDQLGRSFFTKYAALSQTGLTTDADTVSNAMDQVIADTATKLASPRLYVQNDVKSVVDSPDAFSRYAAIVRPLALAYSSGSNEADVALQAYEGGDLSQLSSIDAIATRYAQGISILTAAQVPSSLAKYHLNLLNGYSAMLFSARAFRDMDRDPVSGMNAIGLDAAASQLVNDSFAAIEMKLPASIGSLNMTDQHHERSS